MSVYDWIKNKVNEKKQLAEYQKKLSMINLNLLEEDLENISFILNNPNEFNCGPQPKLEKYSKELSSDEVVETILEFYDSINLGTQMRSVYQKYKDQIFIFEYDYPPDGGYTSGGNKVRDLENGKLGICRIKNSNNCLTYFNAVHEFMHILINEYNKINNETSESHTRFMETLFGEFGVNKGLLTHEENITHQKVNKSVFDNAELISAVHYLQTLINQNGGKLTSKIKKQFIKEFCKSDLKMFYDMVKKVDEKVEAHESDGLENNLRFVNAAVEQKQLYNLYKENPDTFKKAYSDLLIYGNGIAKNIDYSETINYINRNIKNIILSNDSISNEDTVKDRNHSEEEFIKD